jgi:hypothetical protein
MTVARKQVAAGPAAPGWKRTLVLASLLIAILLVAANAHLVYVAVVSQPDCVPHLKDAGSGGAYRAARSSC